jgi:YgiT-type zinc finger domain-containing protein
MNTKEPTISDKDLDTLRKQVLQTPQEPLFPAGHVSACPVCSGADTMVTTNRLTHVVATPGGVREITRLPGAQCHACGAKQFDPAALALIEEHRGSTIWADYDTRVSRSGNVPAILVKEDLRRVLGIHPGDHLSWRVIDRDHALVEVKRVGRET